MWFRKRSRIDPTAGAELVVGGIYLVRSGQGFQIAKVLMIDDEGVHIRVYKNKLSDPAGTVDVSTLTLGRWNDPDGFSAGHIPLRRNVFLAWQPVLLTQTTVEKNELEGYEIWKENQGGYWENVELK